MTTAAATGQQELKDALCFLAAHSNKNNNSNSRTHAHTHTGSKLSLKRSAEKDTRTHASATGNVLPGSYISHKDVEDAKCADKKRKAITLN